MSRKRAAKPASTTSRIGTTTKAYLKPEETSKLEKAATNLRDRLLISLLSRLGCRVSEVLGIKVEDLDMVNHTVTIQYLKARIQL